MSTRFRHLMMWLLLLALPVQGWAMVTMQQCASSHAGTMQRVAIHDESSSSSHHSHHHAQHDHDQQGEPGALSPDQNSDAQCSACASCCMGAVLPVIFIALNVSKAPSTPQVSVLTPTWHFFTTGPDRPPRIPLV
ncbi:MAG: hypothetical protein ACKOF9_05650 [Burkholderiales bacterium]